MDFWILHGDHSVILVKVCFRCIGSLKCWCFPFHYVPFAFFLPYIWDEVISQLKILVNVKFTAIHNLANKYREDFKFPNLKLTFNNRQGFYFSIPQKSIQGKLPSQFIQVQNRLSLKVVNILQPKRESSNISFVVISDLICFLRRCWNMGIIYIAQLWSLHPWVLWSNF